MTRIRRIHRRVSALLSILLLAGALLPAWSGAGGAAGNWAEVCTAEGSSWVLVSHAVDEPGSRSGASHGWFDHCPMCANGAHGAAPPPAGVAFADSASFRDEWPGRFYQAAVTPHPWRPAQPRGPPSFS